MKHWHQICRWDSHTKWAKIEKWIHVFCAFSIKFTSVRSYISLPWPISMKLMQNTDKLEFYWLHFTIVELCTFVTLLNFCFCSQTLVCLDQMLRHLNTMLITTNNRPRLNSASVTISVLSYVPLQLEKLMKFLVSAFQLKFASTRSYKCLNLHTIFITTKL